MDNLGNFVLEKATGLTFMLINIQDNGHPIGISEGMNFFVQFTRIIQ